MPAKLLVCFLKAIPKLVASESLQESLVVKVGSGWMEKSSQQRIVGQWKRQASGKESFMDRKEQRATSRQASDMGMGIVITDA